MRAITLHAPWATLLVTRQPCSICTSGRGYQVLHGHTSPGMVKRFETRSWPCPPSIIGQRVAFHQGKKLVGGIREIGDWKFVPLGDEALVYRPHEHEVHLPLGAVVGSGVITASLPIVDSVCQAWGDPCILARSDGLWHYHDGARTGRDDISDQLPYGDWTPGRYAWLIEDAAPTTERCPCCWGEGGGPAWPQDDSWCRACDGAGRCDPIPATGRQGFWNWEAS